MNFRGSERSRSIVTSSDKPQKGAGKIPPKKSGKRGERAEISK